jgi:phosphoenolpyruvate carboxykinase (diphosphate)
VKRYYRPEWGENWREHFTVDRINGFLGHELKFDNQKLVGNYLRVGYDPDGSWRIYKLRPDFNPADKVQVEDDITASVVLPRESLNDLDPEYRRPQREAGGKLRDACCSSGPTTRSRGADKQAEADIAGPGNVHFELRAVHRGAQARAIVDHVVEFDQYTEPMKKLLESFARKCPARLCGFLGASAHGGRQASKNPRYLQRRPDLVNPRETYLAEIAARLAREIPAEQAGPLSP